MSRRPHHNATQCTIDMLAERAPALASRFAERWRISGLADRVRWCWSARLTRALGRTYPKKSLIRLSVLLLTRDFIGYFDEVVCHEFALGDLPAPRSWCEHARDRVERTRPKGGIRPQKKSVRCERCAEGHVAGCLRTRLSSMPIKASGSPSAHELALYRMLERWPWWRTDHPESSCGNGGW